MAELHEIIDKVCKEKGITANKMCIDLGLPRSTMTELRKGRHKGMTSEKLSVIADYLTVSVDYLLGRTDNPTLKPALYLHPASMKFQRKRMEQSVQKMADLLHIPKETYTAFEEGKETPPQNVVDFLTYFFGVTEDYLFGRTSYPYDPNANLVEKNVLRLDDQGQKKEAPAVLEAAEALRQYFINKLGREPTDDELDKLADFAEIYIKGLDK